MQVVRQSSYGCFYDAAAGPDNFVSNPLVNPYLQGCVDIYLKCHGIAREKGLAEAGLNLTIPPALLRWISQITMKRLTAMPMCCSH